MSGMAKLTTQQVLEWTDEELWANCNHDVRTRFGNFIKEFNKREWSVRIGKTHESFEAYSQQSYVHKEEFGTGFVISGRPIPYFHPNRSFHDEVIWLNNNLYYDREVSFTNKLVNSAIVKFYGPSRTLSIITGHVTDIPGIVQTSTPYIDFDRLSEDTEYAFTLGRNIEKASSLKKQLWGTTELRTSLQIAARNHGRANPTPIDKFIFNTDDVKDQIKDRKMRPSDMIYWIQSVTPAWVSFYKTKPTMKESYEYLTSIRGIGPYYGYHFSSNLSRMPGVGSAPLIEREHSAKFADLKIEHGNLDEDADYVVAGPGASYTLGSLFPSVPVNNRTTMALILKIRDIQHKFLDISNEMDYKYLSESTELGRFTTFGIEIACCQFSVFTRLKDNPQAASARANAPISKEVGNGTSTIESFFS